MKTLIAQFAWLATALLASAALGADVATSGPGGSSEYPGAYHIVNLASFGGTDSGGNSINNLGLVAGYSNKRDDQTRHASLWFFGRQVDLDTLGGPNSNVAWPVKNTRGLVVGISQTATPEPLGETWSCRNFFPFPTRSGFTCLGFAWEHGVMRRLPTLGGNNGFATGANNYRQIVGWAENTVHDPTCILPQQLQFRAVVWGPKKKQIRELPPLPGDSTSAATAINDEGQVVGISGRCGTAVGRFSARHSVLWENGQPKNIGDLGGVAWNTPMAINAHGDVVGFSNVSADDADNFRAHAFIWTKSGGIKDLATLPGHETGTSQALGINNHGQVVGMSCDVDFLDCRAFLWQNGVMTDINDLVAADYPDTLIFANDINDAGKIAGGTLIQGTTEQRAFVALPVGGHHENDSVSTSRAMGASKRGTVMPAAVRQAIMERLGLGDT